MRIFHTLLVALTLHTASSQCPFDPTITPDDLILCPSEEAVLTTQVYDAYQWVKDGNQITGATAQTLPVEQYADAGSSFRVAATLEGCTELSPPVLVDGWVFLLPYVITNVEPLYIGSTGVAYYCEDDTASLSLGMPYTENIQWTNNGVDIPGATDDTLFITATGSYSVSGAPELCPDYMQHLGLSVDLQFVEPTQPVVEPSGDELCATPTGLNYQWYLNGDPVGPNTACIEPTQPGTYSVYVTYQVDCSIPSEGVLITGVNTAGNNAEVTFSPMPANTELVVSWQGSGSLGAWVLTDALGRTVRESAAPGVSPLRVPTHGLAPGKYAFRTAAGAYWPVLIAP
jgi:hypothetical protein